MRDEPEAGAMPAASPRRHVGHRAVVFAVRPPGNRTAAEAKTWETRIAARPAAGLWGERADLCGGGQAWVGEGGCLGARRRGLNEEGGGRPGLGVAVCPGGDRDGGLLDLGNRHRLRGQEAKHNGDSAWDAAIAVLPAPDAPRADAEQLGDAVLCDAERAECRAEFGRVRLFRLGSVQGAPQREALRQRSRTAIKAAGADRTDSRDFLRLSHQRKSRTDVQQNR
jgi:hypothetical protein